MSGAANRKVEDQTMEDILNSIRRIIADDHRGVAPAAPAERSPVAPRVQPEPKGSIEDDILALRTALNAIRGEMEDVREDVAGQEEFYPDEGDIYDEDENLADTPASYEEDDALLSVEAEESVRQSFSRLSSELNGSSRREFDIEANATALLRSMMKEWLDENLPALVERLVQEEINRLVGR